jgi:3-hydroxybutyryl-CoA dehydratase
MDRFLLFRTFDELELGATQRTRGRTVTETDIVNWCALTGDWFYPHSDEVAAAASMFGRRVAPGIMVFAIATGLGVPADSTTILANYGSDRLRYTKPVFVGDTVHLEIELEDKEARDVARGLATFRWDVMDQRDELVCTSRLKLLMSRHAVDYPGAGPSPGLGVAPSAGPSAPR